MRCVLFNYVNFVRTLGSKKKGKEIVVEKADNVEENLIDVEEEDSDNDFVDVEWNNSGKC